MINPEYKSIHNIIDGFEGLIMEDKINILKSILNLEQTISFFKAYSLLIRENDIDKYKITTGTSYSYNIYPLHNNK